MSTQIPTPRTDAELERISYARGKRTHDALVIRFARQLERERIQRDDVLREAESALKTCMFRRIGGGGPEEYWFNTIGVESALKRITALQLPPRTGGKV